MRLEALALLLISRIVVAQYVPEPYGWACFRMAAKRSWPSCASVHRTKQKECLCQLPEFVLLTESCLNDAVANLTGDVEHIKALARRESLCRLPEMDSKDSDQHRVKKPLDHTEVPEMQYIEPINDEDITIALLTAKWRMTNDRRAMRAGVILIAYWVMIVLVRYFASLIKRCIPGAWFHYIMTRTSVKKFQSRVLKSPLFRQRHCQPCLGFLAVRLPTRMFSVLIAVFAVANYVLIFTDYPYEPSNFIYSSRTQQYNKSLAIRAAFMIMWKIPLLVCFSGRNNIFLLLRHPWPLDTFNVLHKWIARITVVDIVIHSVAISLVKAEQGLYGSVWKVDYWQWGVCGTIVTSVIAIQSMHWISKRHYDAFVAIHVVLAVVFLVSAWHHVYTLPYGKYHVIATCAIWGLDRAIRIIRILAAGTIEAGVHHCDTDVTILTVTAPRLYAHLKQHSSNSYVFLHVPSWYLFWQSHPFTIFKRGFEKSESETNNDRHVDTNRPTVAEKITASESGHLKGNNKPVDEGSELMICIKHRRGVTKYISNLPEGPLIIALDGPYGYSHALHEFSRIVLFAGGIGITPVIGYAKRALELRSDDTEIKIHWAVRHLAPMRWAFEELASASRNVSIVAYVSEDDEGCEITTKYRRRVTFVHRRLVCQDVLKTEVASLNASDSEFKAVPYDGTSNDVPHNLCGTAHGPRSKRESLAIFSCGPDRLNDDARVAACWAIETAKVYVDYKEESFTW